MKDSRSILLLIVSVLLILVSCALLWTWGYNFNSFAKEKGKEKPAPAVIIKDSVPAPNFVRDSLQRIYTATINNLGTLDSTWTHADSLKADLDIKLSEFYKLRNEIAVILKNPAKKEDLDLARQKIGELQKKIDQLRNANTDVENENKRLYAMLQQLTSTSQIALPEIKSAANESGGTAVKNYPAAIFSASDIQLTALMVDDNRELETLQALQTDKFIGTFTVKNNSNPFINTEIVVVVVQPDNKVLQASAWESGRFDTKEGKKIYSCKVKFDYIKGENKRLSFSLTGDKFQKGIYTMQLYYNGSIIGRIAKTLI